MNLMFSGFWLSDFLERRHFKHSHLWPAQVMIRSIGLVGGAAGHDSWCMDIALRVYYLDFEMIGVPTFQGRYSNNIIQMHITILYSHTFILSYVHIVVSWFLIVCMYDHTSLNLGIHFHDDPTQCLVNYCGYNFGYNTIIMINHPQTGDNHIWRTSY
jgi:hypothetical protein